MFVHQEADMRLYHDDELRPDGGSEEMAGEEVKETKRKGMKIE